MSKKIIKRNVLSILSYCVLETLFLRGTTHIEWGHIEFIQIVNILGLIVVGILILKFIFLPYIVLEGRSILINHNFTKDTISIDDVSELDIDDGFFVLKNGRKVKYHSFMISKKGIELLRGFFKGISESQ
jgi:hypothetical protein